MSYRELFAAVRKAPRMYLPDDRYHTAVAFVCGCHAASQGRALDGFTEWLQVRSGRVSSWAFDRLISELAGASGEQADLDTLFRYLDEFLAEREGRGGLRKIYDDYFDLLRREGLYDTARQGWT